MAAAVARQEQQLRVAQAPADQGTGRGAEGGRYGVLLDSLQPFEIVEAAAPQNAEYHGVLAPLTRCL